jgi:hypothetical protein
MRKQGPAGKPELGARKHFPARGSEPWLEPGPTPKIQREPVTRDGSLGKRSFPPPVLDLTLLCVVPRHVRWVLDPCSSNRFGHLGKLGQPPVASTFSSFRAAARRFALSERCIGVIGASGLPLACGLGVSMHAWLGVGVLRPLAGTSSFWENTTLSWTLITALV